MADRPQAGQRSWEGEMFRLLVENVKDYAIFVLDAEGRVLTWSEGAERLLGYRDDEIIGESAERFFTPEDVAGGVPEQEMRRALEAGRGEDDRWHVRKDGSRFWSNGVMTPLKDEGGTLRGFAKIMRDRTELKRAESARNDALAYAQGVVETVREPLVVLDGDLRVRTANRSFYGTFRVSEGETEGRLLYDLGSRQWDIPELRRLLEDILPQNTVFNDFEVAHDFPAIGRKVMLLNARRIYREQNHTQFILLAIEDITERRRVEDALAAQQEWQRVTLGSIGDAVIATDVGSRVTYLNPVAEALTGWTTAEAVGQPLEAVFRIVNEETRHTVENPVTKAIREGTVVGLDNHTLLIRKDGSERAIDDSAAPIRDASGGVIGVVLVFHDITERRRVERAVRDALDYAENIVETVREPMLVLDGQLRVRTANRSFYQAFKVSKPETEGQLLYDLGNGQWDIPKLRTLLEEVLPQNTAFNDFEVAHVFPAMGRKVMLLNARRMYREGNRTELILLAIEDITERRRLEDERRELETRFTSLVKNIRDHSIFTLDPQGHITSWNREAERILGYGEAEALGQHFSIIFTPEDRQAGVPGQELATALSEGRAEDERWHVRKGGERFWALGIVTPTQDATGAHTGYSKILRDMTDRKRAEEALRNSEARLAAELEGMTRLHDLTTRLVACQDPRTALDEILDASITMHGADMGNVQVYNPQAQALEIAAQRGFRQDFLDQFRSVTSEEDTACGRAIRSGERAVIEDVQTEPGYEPYREAATAAGYRAVQSTPLVSRQGELLGVLSTHFRQPHRPSERDLRMLDLYARQVADIMDRLRAEEALREADRRKDEFLAMLAHELRNPLAPIRNALHVVQMRGQERRQAVREAWEMIERQVENLVRLVDDLLDVSRISRGKINLQKEPIDVATLVARAVEGSRPLIEARRHELEVTLPDEPMRVEADPTRMAQVLWNLLNNAAKYTPEGGRIWLTAEKVGGEAVIRVRDTGMGLPPEMLPKVFDLFTQAERTLDRAEGGLGIGLTLVRRLTEMHDGVVQAFSAGPGEGSEFVVRLPLLSDGSPAAAPAQEPDGGKRAKVSSAHRILVVDDNRDSADSLAMLLRLVGHDVRTVHDGRQALVVAATYRPDLVLLDIGLPGMDGFAVARQMRSQPELAGAVLVAVTGYGSEEDRRRSEAAGFDYHMVKPIHFDALQELLTALEPHKK